jgi:hypothetical protein|tara:strand:+ start:213 stop:629 length:417 start_codon:yes stop_codon:yes gene_type:complete
MVNLKDVLQESKTAELEFPGYKGFKVKIGLISRQLANKIRKDCTVTRMSDRYSSMEETLDENKFAEKFTNAAIKGWEGLTGEYVKDLLPVNDDQVNDEDEIPYNHDNAVLLIKNSTAFEAWVNEVAFKLKYFRGEQSK